MSLLAVQTLTSILIRVNPNDESSLRTLKLVSKDFRKAIQRICGMLLSVYASLEMELRCMFETAHDVHKHFEDDGKNKQAQFEDTEHKLLIYFTYAHGTTKVLYIAPNDQSHFMNFMPRGLQSGCVNVYSHSRTRGYSNLSYRVRPIELLKQRIALPWV